jgi:hypothetical protein
LLKKTKSALGMRRVRIVKAGGFSARGNLCGHALVCAALVFISAHAFAADDVPAQGGNAPPGGEISPSGPYQEGVNVDGWMLFPSLYVGGVYDTNKNQAPSGFPKDSGGSLRVAPRLIATHTDGAIHGTTLFGVGDFRFFDANTITADAGASHDYRPTQDLTFNVNGRYTRQTDLFTSPLNFNNNAIGPSGTPQVPLPIVINPFGTSPSVNPIAYNQFTGGAAVSKTFGEGFASVTGTVFHIAFDHGDNAIPPFNTSHDSTAFWLAGRVGYHIIPTLYAFGEATGVWQRFNNSIFDTNGYRVVGGIGTDDKNNLLRGEVYGGYQFQHQQQQAIPNFGVPQDSDAPLFGGRVMYYPTQYWTVIGSVDTVLSMSTILAPTIPQGTPNTTTTALLQTTYGLSRQWSIGGRVGYTRSKFDGLDRLDTGWMAGASFNYEIWRNLILTLDYQYSTLNSNVPFNDFTKNVYSAGLTYRY